MNECEISHKPSQRWLAPAMANDETLVQLPLKVQSFAYHSTFVDIQLQHYTTTKKLVQWIILVDCLCPRGLTPDKTTLKKVKSLKCKSTILEKIYQHPVSFKKRNSLWDSLHFSLHMQRFRWNSFLRGCDTANSTIPKVHLEVSFFPFLYIKRTEVSTFKTTFIATFETSRFSQSIFQPSRDKSFSTLSPNY